MSRGTWNNIKHSKSFYVIVYRRALKLALILLILNLLLLLGIIYKYFHTPEPNFYATSGVLPPVQLTPRALPNNSSEPLLANEPENKEGKKLIPN
jgi:intracellular multiplication protein IcmM